MNVANLELCKELYNLSGWKETDYFYQYQEYKDGSNGYTLVNPALEAPLQSSAYPAYDLGYLLRKLPRSVKGDTYRLGLVDNVNSYRAGYYNERFWEAYEQYGDTPEDAVAKVVITLSRQGILKRH